MAIGRLRVQVFQGQSFVPVENTKVTVIPRTGAAVSAAPQQTLNTDPTGQTEEIELSAPPVELSQVPTNQTPYSFCDLQVEAPGYVPLSIRGVQILPEITALQQCNLMTTREAQMRGITSQEIVIPAHKLVENYELMKRQEKIIVIDQNTLVGNFPPKIPEAEEKPLPPEKGTVVLENVVVPEFVIVHDGNPDDPNVPNYKVRYKDYIKNVASCEIFSTWPETTIRANLYCIISFTLNRIYTEWYRNKGKDFTITTSTAFDQAFSYGRNIYDNINRIVDEIFSTYIKRPDAKQPLFAQYCDGVKVQCPGWLTQWGSKFLGDQGKIPYEILTNFYGTNLELRRAPEVAGIPVSYPGTVLALGSKGTPVRDIQTYLNRISQDYPLIPKLAVDGVYGPDTENSVKIFQQVFGLPQTGKVDYSTWYKISEIYVGVSKLAELRTEEPIDKIVLSVNKEEVKKPQATVEAEMTEEEEAVQPMEEDPYVPFSRKGKCTSKTFFTSTNYDGCDLEEILKAHYMYKE